MKEIKKILIPTGYKFLSECIKELPSNCIFNKGITGSGGTTLEIKSNRHSIICVPNISLLSLFKFIYDFILFSCILNIVLDELLSSLCCVY